MDSNHDFQGQGLATCQLVMTPHYSGARIRTWVCWVMSPAEMDQTDPPLLYPALASIAVDGSSVYISGSRGPLSP